MRLPLTILAISVAASAASATPTPDDARQVVRSYYAAIERHDYPAAFRLWDEGGPMHQSLAGFEKGFADTARVAVVTSPPRDAEGAAGSFYVNVPVVVTATQRDATVRRYAGSYTLRRPDAQIPGAATQGSGWLLYSADLKVRPAH